MPNTGITGSDRKILIVGLDNGWNLESSYTRAFRSLGARVELWDPAGALKSVARGAFIGNLFGRFVNVEPWWRKANLKLLSLCESFRPDLILVIATEGVRAGTLGQLRVQLPETLIYCLFPDTPHNLVPDRISSLPMFDRVCPVSPAWIDPFRRLGARSVFWLPLAADPDLHRRIGQPEDRTQEKHDVVFIGNWRPEREAFLEQLADFDLQIWGSSYWKRQTRPDSKLPAIWARRGLFGEEFARACRTHLILLNFIDGVGWPGPNMRTFEQPACGAFSLVTRTPAVTEIFSEGETIECFESVAEARDKIRFYLANSNARQKIAEAGYRFVVEGGHTYVDRARTILRWAKQDGLN